MRGAKLAEALINQEGGVNGIPVRLLLKDHQGDTRLSRELAKNMIVQEKVPVIVGPGLSPQAIATAEVAQAHGVPMISTTAQDPSVSTGRDFVFMAAFPDVFHGSVMADFALAGDDFSTVEREGLASRTAAVFIQNRQDGSPDPYSKRLADAFTQRFTEGGGSIVYVGTYKAFVESPVRSLKSRARKSRYQMSLDLLFKNLEHYNPQVVFVPGVTSDIVKIVRRYRKHYMGYGGTFLGGNGWVLGDLETPVKKRPMLFLDDYFSDSFSAEGGTHLTPEAEAFIQAYEERFNEKPTVMAALNYDAVRIAVRAMRLAGGIERIAVRDQIANMTHYKGATTLFEYDNNGHPLKSAVIRSIFFGEIKFHQLVSPVSPVPSVPPVFPPLD